MSFCTDFDHSLPELPQIVSEKIRLQVFTHRSYYARPTHIFEDHMDDPSPDNEKLEHLGDTVLGFIVSTLLLEMYPGLRVGPSTKIRASVVGNKTLAEISCKYKLPDRLRLHPAQALTLRASMNIQADVFESFVGGLYLDQGLEQVSKWIRELFRPYMQGAYNTARIQHGLAPAETPTSLPQDDGDSPVRRGTSSSDTLTGHLALFNQHLQKEGREVEWIYCDAKNAGADEFGIPDVGQTFRGSSTTPMWLVKVRADGEYLGWGRGNTKKVARNEAAKEGLISLGVNI